MPGDIAGSETIIATAAAKSALRAASGAVAVDMESAAVARLAREAGIPFAVVRAVSDPAQRALPMAARAGFGADGVADIGAVLQALLRRPYELPALIRTAIEAEAGFSALKRAAGVIR